MNKIILIGNLTRDPETNTHGATRFTVAVQRPFKRDTTDFFDCTAWRTVGERVQEYLKKGSKCAVVGSAEINKVDTENGTKYFYNVNVQEVEFLSPRQDPPVEKEQITVGENTSLPF